MSVKCTLGISCVGIRRKHKIISYLKVYLDDGLATRVHKNSTLSQSHSVLILMVQHPLSTFCRTMLNDMLSCYLVEYYNTKGMVLSCCYLVRPKRYFTSNVLVSMHLNYQYLHTLDHLTLPQEVIHVIASQWVVDMCILAKADDQKSQVGS